VILNHNIRVLMELEKSYECETSFAKKIQCHSIDSAAAALLSLSKPPNSVS